MSSLLLSNIMSRLMGVFASISWPFPLNILFVGGFKRLVGIRLNDAQRERLSDYSSIQDIFTRSLKPEGRPIGDGIVSPCDGKVFDEGRIYKKTKFIVKGDLYQADELIGSFDESLEEGYYCSIYLSPKDCHQYRLPCDATIKKVTHIPAKCLPVHPLFMKFVPKVYTKNERVVVELQSHGLRYYMVMVAALNVGKMTIDALPDLQSNSKKARVSKCYEANTLMKKGDKLGQFELGSTIVLLFPKQANLKSMLTHNEQVLRYGQPIYQRQESHDNT